jgi:hypothetical protein
MSKQHFKNIEEALKVLRPNDLVDTILSNKFAIVQPAYDNGRYDSTHVCGLNESEIHFYCKWYGEAKAQFIEVAKMPNTKQQMIAYYTNVKLQLGCDWRLKTIDNRKYKRQYRKLHQLLKANFDNSWLK